MNEFKNLFEQAEREILQWSGSDIKEIIWRDGLLLVIHKAQMAKDMDEVAPLLERMLQMITDRGHLSHEFAPALDLIGQSLERRNRLKDQE